MTGNGENIFPYIYEDSDCSCTILKLYNDAHNSGILSALNIEYGTCGIRLLLHV